jgi:uncharacterized oligopeptide transporter (OPT) family protein
VLTCVDSTTREKREDTVAESVQAKIEEPKFQPYVPATEVRPEFTARAIIFGGLFGVLFGAVTVYVGLRAGLTVAASIPIAVLSISILRALGKASILENNIVQTAGSAGESVAGGVIFTLPALIFLGFGLDYWRITLLALIGGCLGVCFMIPLRRQLIVKEHGNLRYPEGTACADVLIAGDKGGSFASRVFAGLGLGPFTPSSRMRTCSRSGPVRLHTIRPGCRAARSGLTRQPSTLVWVTSSDQKLPELSFRAASLPGWW